MINLQINSHLSLMLLYAFIANSWLRRHCVFWSFIHSLTNISRDALSLYLVLAQNLAHIFWNLEWTTDPYYFIQIPHHLFESYVHHVAANKLVNIPNKNGGKFC